MIVHFNCKLSSSRNLIIFLSQTVQVNSCENLIMKFNVHEMLEETKVKGVEELTSTFDLPSLDNVCGCAF